MTLALIAIVAAAVALWLAQRLGRARAERDFREKAHDDAVAQVARAKEIDESVDRLDDHGLDDGLRAFRRR